MQTVTLILQGPCKNSFWQNKLLIALALLYFDCMHRVFAELDMMLGDSTDQSRHRDPCCRGSAGRSTAVDDI